MQLKFKIPNIWHSLTLQSFKNKRRNIGLEVPFNQKNDILFTRVWDLDRGGKERGGREKRGVLGSLASKDLNSR